ncbi:MAG TPA: hypothetical protein PLX10_00325 [Candidatus Paceibacterota bacterium]|nr:hypothetical protein [Candidatus Paceibacterota bacterium]
MNESLSSLATGLSDLCREKGFRVGKAQSMKCIDRIERIERIKILKEHDCLVNIYSEAMPKWHVLTARREEDISFTVYFKKRRKEIPALALVEMTPKFASRYNMLRYRNDSFWNMLEDGSSVPIWGVVWNPDGNPIVCHCGD